MHYSNSTFNIEPGFFVALQEEAALKFRFIMIVNTILEL